MVEQLAVWLGKALEWTDTERKAEIQRALQILADEHGVRI
jgi:hypothetical protein